MESDNNVSTWWLTIEGVPKLISAFIQGFTENPYVFLSFMLLVYIIIGLFIEQAAVPYLIAMAMILAMVTYLPQFYLWLPKMFGF